MGLSDLGRGALIAARKQDTQQNDTQVKSEPKEEPRGGNTLTQNERNDAAAHNRSNERRRVLGVQKSHLLGSDFCSVVRSLLR